MCAVEVIDGLVDRCPLASPLDLFPFHSIYS